MVCKFQLTTVSRGVRTFQTARSSAQRPSGAPFQQPRAALSTGNGDPGLAAPALKPLLHEGCGPGVPSIPAALTVSR